MIGTKKREQNADIYLLRGGRIGWGLALAGLGSALHGGGRAGGITEVQKAV